MPYYLAVFDAQQGVKRSRWRRIRLCDAHAHPEITGVTAEALDVKITSLCFGQMYAEIIQADGPHGLPDNLWRVPLIPDDINTIMDPGCTLHLHEGTVVFDLAQPIATLRLEAGRHAQSSPHL